jgi:hypothetical protein
MAQEVFATIGARHGRCFFRYLAQNDLFNPRRGQLLCVAGTMDDYATVVDSATLAEGPLVEAAKPCWATVTGDGTACVISESGADRVTSIDFAIGEKIASVPVGDHPQRVRLGHVPGDWTSTGLQMSSERSLPSSYRLCHPAPLLDVSCTSGSRVQGRS